MRPQRVSSEAPEVVPQLPGLNFGKRNTHVEKQVADRQSPELGARFQPTAVDPPGGEYETPESVSSPREAAIEYRRPTLGHSTDITAYDAAKVPAEKQNNGRRVCGLVTTIILVIVAFIIGGGIGGGIGGAIAANNKNKSSSPSSSSTATVSASPTTTAAPSTTTMIVDVAGCPNINNTTYNSTVTPYTFLQACATDIQPVNGQYIDVANKVASSFDSCLDWCAQYTGNATTKGQCVAATWVIFSAADPGRNSRCYLKNSTGTAIPQGSNQQLVTGYLNNA